MPDDVMTNATPRATRLVALALSNPRTRVTGTVASPAQQQTHTDGTHSVVVTLQQKGGLPVLVHRCYGHGDYAELLATHTAKEAKPGIDFTAEGEHLAFDPESQSLVLSCCVTLAPARMLVVAP